MGIHYKKATAALDDLARARLWGPSVRGDIDSMSSEDSDELANLVNSFYDSELGESNEGSEARSRSLHETESEDSIEMLDSLLGEMEDELEVGQIRIEVDRAIRVTGSGPDERFFKERIVDKLRKRGFDAGLCKSSWEQSDGPPAGSHEFIDIITRGKTRYIIEPNLPSNFEIARPSEEYTRLFRRLPKVFVGRPDHLKNVIRVMSTAAVQSMKSAGMHIPPWRRREYVLAKWFSPHKRSANVGSVKIEKMSKHVKNCRMAIEGRDNRISRGNFHGNVA